MMRYRRERGGRGACGIREGLEPAADGDFLGVVFALRVRCDDGHVSSLLWVHTNSLAEKRLLPR